MISAILLLACSGLPTSLAQMKAQKRITSFQSGETSSGTRVSVFSDAALNDYEAFRRGDRFYVKIPAAAFDAAQPKLRGEGFDDLQVQRVGDSIVVSFKLQPGTTARVDQRSNRLDVYFTSQNRAAARSSVPNNVGNHAGSNPIQGIVTLNNTQSQQARRNPSTAGPMPPDTPGVNRPRVVTQQPIAERQLPEATSSRSLNQESSNRTSNRPSSANTKTEQSPVANASSPIVKTEPPVPVPPTTSNTYPVSSATPYSTLSTRPTIAPVAPSKFSELSKKFDVVTRWVSANRVPSAVGAALLFGLVVFGLAMLYRRRRKVQPSRRAKVPGVQPKYSPESDVDEFDHLGDEVYETVFDDYEPEARRSTPVVDLPFADASVSERNQWAEDFSQTTVAQTPAAARPVTSSYVPATPTIPIHAMKHEEYEREVFEL